ncbi:monocarboxylate transporter 12-like [Asterias amurensis]|uniref:monocarboxylate transporter 12-like n=1 Tax=Asterias amurensis TaxID=7602 RepID=UPI003AB3D80D
MSNSRGRRTSKPLGKDSDPPDGGWGYVIVVAVFIVYFLQAALTRCAGVLYTSWQIDFNSSAAETGAIVSIMSSSAYFGAIVASVVLNRLGCRFAWMCGGFLMFAALILSFWATTILQMYLIGAVTGLGIALCFTAAGVALAQYFNKYFARVSGFTSSGIGLGMIVTPPLLRVLLDMYGWRGTMLIMGAICLNVCAVGALYRPLGHARTTRHQNDSELLDEKGSGRVFVDKDNRCSSFMSIIRKLFSELRLDLLVKSYRFTLYCLMYIELSIVYIVYVVYIMPMALDYGFEKMNSTFLLSVMGFGSLGGRAVSGFLIRPNVSAEAVFGFSQLLSTIGVLCTQAEGGGGLVASACFMGIGTGMSSAVSIVLLRKIVGLRNLASAIGIFYMLGGIGDLAGPIIAGWMYDEFGSLVVVFYGLAGLQFIATLQIFLMPLLKKLEPGIEDDDGQPQPVQV